MYDSEFDTGWDDLDKDGALERSFALGVARSLGEPNREEYERVLASADTTYRRSLLQLAYDEGRRKASDRSAEAAAAVWETLVVEPDDVDPTAPEEPRAEDDSDAGTRSTTGPPPLVSRPRPRALPDDGLDRVRLPEFLRRR
jgi:hypothetical protein